tara:strand:- start:57 stop:428 length:372 start_codon:yes stop_codon:yes gene_type:complete
MDEEDIKRLVKRELAAFKKAQAKVDADQKRRLQQLAGMKQQAAKITADACRSKGLLSMQDFLVMMNKIRSAEKGDLFKSKKEELMLDEDDSFVDLSGVLELGDEMDDELDDEMDNEVPLGGSP